VLGSSRSWLLTLSPNGDADDRRHAAGYNKKRERQWKSNETVSSRPARGVADYLTIAVVVEQSILVTRI
jgi:hypothetical protein